MTSTISRLRRALFGLLALTLLAGALPISPAEAATRLFVVANDLGEIWEVDPTTGVKISGFPLNPANLSTRCGLAFDGTFLYYTDENLPAVIQVYTTAGVLTGTLPRPAGSELGIGLGATKTSLYLLGSDGTVTEIDSTTGAVLQSFVVADTSHGLTFAGSRNSIFATTADGATIKEVSLTGVTLASFPAPGLFRGLAFSSSSNELYGVREGKLWVVNPATGALIAGPFQMTNGVSGPLLKAAAAAADEPVLAVCGDDIVNVAGETCDPPGSTQTNGALCRSDCTYCGDGNLDQGANEQCDDGNTDNTDDCRNDCTLPRCGDDVLDPGEACDDGNNLDGDGCSALCTVEPFCGDGVVQPELGEQCELPNTPGCDANCHATEICTDLIDNDGDGAIDCLDDDCDCLPIGRDPGAIRFGKPGAGDLFAVHGSLDPLTPFSPTTDVVTFLLTNVHGKIYQLEIPAGEVKQIGRNLFRFRNKLAQRNRNGLSRFDLRYFPRKDIYTFVVKSYGDLSLATEAYMSVQLVVGDDAFLNQSTWRKLPKGWLLTLPGE